MNPEVKVKIPSSWGMALYLEYQKQLFSFEESSEHERLLLEHAVTAARMLKAKLEVKALKYTIKFSGPESLAFIQWWGIKPVQLGSVAQVAIAEIIQELDRQSKNVSRLRLV